MTPQLLENTTGLSAVLDVLCPMHVLLDGTGHIRHAGPTLRKLCPDQDLDGMRVMELLELRRPKSSGLMEDLLRYEGLKLHFTLRRSRRTELKGVLVGLPADLLPGCSAVLNLSFGISVVDAVRDFSLTSADFAMTDLTIEMLYLVEAKAAVMDELRHLNLRLDGARVEAEQQAFTDTLTGLGNRRAMDQALSGLTSCPKGFAIMHLDLDHFKEVNDTYGHAAGDEVLTAVAQRLRDWTRASDTVIRQGGDEFLLILPGMTSVKPLEQLGRRLVEVLEEPVPFGHDMLHVSASIGASVSTQACPVLPPEAVEQADVALYVVKENGRHGYRLYSPDMETPAQVGVAGR